MSGKKATFIRNFQQKLLRQQSQRDCIDDLLAVLGRGKPTDETRADMAKDLMGQLQALRGTNRGSPSDSAIQRDADQCVLDGIGWNMTLLEGYLASIGRG